MNSLGKTCLGLVSAFALVAVSGCAEIERQTGLSTETQTGAAVGAAGGGLIAAAAGASTGWVIASAVLGAVAGGLIADYMTDKDKELAGQTTTAALETQPAGAASTWVNPDSGNSGSVTVNDTFQREDGTPCRNFTQTIEAGGETTSGTGTACRAADGTWEVVS